ncbi:hypothetical protein ACQE98_09625, partial [Ornithinimicrobium sp. W1679]|uniref:hypothetical protein n=1 Tax=Ornithinimicrobium sp. W1679 TaxID=3418770 RepID=UPI003CF30CC6
PPAVLHDVPRTIFDDDLDHHYYDQISWFTPVAFQTFWQTSCEGMIGVTMKEMTRGTTTCCPGGGEGQDRAQRPGWRGLDR